MIIQYASDLHLEFGMNSRYMQVYGLAEGGDVLLLAGDIGYLERRRIEQNPFFDWCSRHFREAVIVPGNHEYYRDPIARDGRQDGISVDIKRIAIGGYSRKRPAFHRQSAAIHGIDTIIG